LKLSQTNQIVTKDCVLTNGLGEIRAATVDFSGADTHWNKGNEG
jgi:hypothetical protein